MAITGINDFAKNASKLDDPGTRAYEITPHNTNQLARIPRAIIVGAAGNVECYLIGDESTAVTIYCAAGVPIPIRPFRILATGTAATGIVGLE